MIRLGTTLWLAFAVTAGIGLFQVKYEVQALEKELTRLHREILRDREAIHVLRAEWSYLNEPGRLADLARRHLDMAPVAATQVTRFQDLPDPLPLPPPIPRPLPPASGMSADDSTADGAPVSPDAVLASTRTVP